MKEVLKIIPAMISTAEAAWFSLTTSSNWGMCNYDFTKPAYKQ